MPSKMVPKSIKYDPGSILENSEKNVPQQCRKVEEMGVQRDPTSEPKSLKKGPHHALSLLWGPLGAQGVPGITFRQILVPFLMDCWWILGGCGRLSFVYLGCIFLPCSITPCGAFRSPLSLQVYSGKRLSDAGGSFNRVPFRESSERGRVREGEKGRQPGNEPSNGSLHFGVIFVIFRGSKIGLKKQCRKESP
jgi:hypothetical protein